MKKCPACNHSYSDSTEICPQCGLYLIEDIVSDLQTTGRPSRIHHVSTQQSHLIVQPTNSRGLTPGRHVDDIPHDTPEGGGAPPVVPPGHGVRMFLAVMRFLLPILLIIASIVAIVIFWETIRQFLACCLLGAIVGGIALSYLSVRFGGTFSPGAMISGAVAGIILACTLQYNILDVGTELYVLFEAFGPILIMLLGIWMMIRSIR